jgi:hypothetical protein
LDRPHEANLGKVGSKEASLAEDRRAAVDMPLRKACTEFALPALLQSIQDYTTDNRGDVGSLCAVNYFWLLLALVVYKLP